MYANCCICILISPKFDPMARSNNKPALVQITTLQDVTSHYLNQWWPSLLMMHKCVFWPQWVKPSHNRRIRRIRRRIQRILAQVDTCYCWQRQPYSNSARVDEDLIRIDVRSLYLLSFSTVLFEVELKDTWYFPNLNRYTGYEKSNIND